MGDRCDNVSKHSAWKFPAYHSATGVKHQWQNGVKHPSDKNAAVFLAHELCYQQQSQSGNIENAKVRLHLQQINRVQMTAAGL